jgi:hypothetical protein
VWVFSVPPLANRRRASTNEAWRRSVFVFRDRALAEAPELDYTMAAEILLLIERLEVG